MIRYVSSILAPHERIVHAASLHWVVYIRGVVFIVIGALLGAQGGALIQMFTNGVVEKIALTGLRAFSVIIILIGALALLFGYLRQMSTELVVTSRRVIAKYGFVSITTFEVMLPRVEGANIDQTVLGRLLGYGTLLVHGVGGGVSPIHHVTNPSAFHNALMRAIEKAREGSSSTNAN